VTVKFDKVIYIQHMPDIFYLPLFHFMEFPIKMVILKVADHQPCATREVNFQPVTTEAEGGTI